MTVARPLKLLGRVIGNLIILALLLVGWGVWRLSQGPISLALFETRIEAALSNAATGRMVQIGGAEIALSEPGRHLVLRLTDFTMNKDGVPLLQARDAAATLDRSALLGGHLKLREVAIAGARLIAERAPDGTVTLGLAQGEAAPADAAADPMGAPPAAKSWLDVLRLVAGDDGLTVKLVDASVELVDRALGRSWRLERATVEAHRTAQGSEITADAFWPQEEGQARVGLRATWDARAQDGAGTSGAGQAGTGQAGVTLKLSNLRPARLAEVHPLLAPLAGVDAPFSGGVFARFDGAETLQEVEAWAELGAGVITAAELPDKTLRVAGASAAAAWTPAQDQLTLRQAALRLANGTELRANGTASGLTRDGPGAIQLTAGLFQVPVDELQKLWPAAVAPNPRAWVLANLSEGRISEATVKARLERPQAGAEWSPVEVSGGLQFQKARVQYLKGLPVVEGVDGSASYDLNGMDVFFTTGKLNRLSISDGKALLRGFDAAEQTIDIGLNVVGPLADALAVIDHDPLRYARQVGIDPKQVRGDAKAELRFKFPLLNDLRFSQVELSVKSALTGVRLPKIARDADLTDANLSLDLTRDKLTAAGQGKVAGAAAKLKWDEIFAPKTNQPRRKLTAQMTLDEPGRALLGLGALTEWLKGPTPVEIELTELNDRARSTAIQVRGDLAPTTLKLDPLAWSKPPGIAGQVRATANLKAGKIDSVTDLQLQGPAIDGKGQVRFSPEGGVSLVQMERLKLDRSDMAVTIKPLGAGWAIEAAGPSLDLAAKQQEKQAATPAGPAANEPPLSLSGRFDRVHLAEGGLLREVSVDARSENGRWLRLDARAKPVAEGVLGSLWVKIQPDGPNARLLAGRAENAGAALAALGVTKSLRGGVFHWAGRFDDSVPGGRLRLQVKGEDYRVAGVSGLAKLFSAITLVGIPDLFGEGVGFQTLHVDAVRDERNWVIQEGRAAGLSVGLTVKGRISRADDTLSLSGLVVPVNVLNQVLGAIPLLGDVITGGKGGGLIAWSWRATGPAGDPDVSVNPLSMLAPGILRNLFDSNDTETGK